MRRRWRIAILISAAVAAIALALLSPPVPQDPLYHRFADQRTLAGMPHFWNVVSNAAFLVAGLYGLWAVRHARWAEPAGRYPWLTVALAAILIGLGSSYYHQSPNNRTLFWDRLPMTLAFMGIFSAAIVEYIHARVGVLLLAPFLLLGILSVEVWRRGELTGVGDLRFYILVQFYPMIALPLILLLFRSRYTHSSAMWVMGGLYLLAKIFEGTDAAIFRITGGVLSGHALKHLAAAAALLWVFRSLPKRRPAIAA